MRTINKVILIGNLANDPEFRTTQSGVSNCNFRIAVQRRFANAQGVREADFLNCVTWRQTADIAHKYLRKGSKIGLEGSIQVRSYDAQDGSKRWVTEIVVDSIEFVSSRSDGDSSGSQPNNEQAHRSNTIPGIMQSPKPRQQSMDDFYKQNGFTEVDDDDELPF